MKCDNCASETRIVINVKWESENDNRTHQGYWCRSCCIGGNYFLVRNDTK